jgi:hypothetical protein
MNRRTLRDRVALILVVVLFSTCGGDKRAAQIGIVNQTRHSDAQLWSLWHAAQQNLSQQIDLNPVQRVSANASPDILPGDPRVRNVAPHQIEVASQADVSAATLLAATGMHRPDPTGLIACPQPCNVNYAPAYSQYAQPVSRYAASWESSESNFDFLVQYEFENQILSALGYDTRWR